ncbi:MAG: phage tail tube protein [Candidatus Saccharibacteria bacterium]|nr:phage tail tube protein [Candidatus Saccharibacteria bacterium]
MAGVQTMATSLTLKKAGSEPSDLVLAHIVSIGEQSTEADEIDVTTLDSPNRSKEYIQGAKDPGSIDVTANNCFDGQVQKLSALFDSGDIREWVETYPDGKGTLTYSGFVKAFKYGEATTDGLATVSFTIRLSGKPVYTENES